MGQGQAGPLVWHVRPKLAGGLKCQPNFPILAN